MRLARFARFFRRSAPNMPARIAAGVGLAALVVGLGFGGCTIDANGTQEQNCTGDSQCDDGLPCTVDTCNASGQCDHAPAADGLLPADQQTPGDCQAASCSAGVAQYQADNDDDPDDGDPCTDDSCVDGQPHFDTQAANGGPCDLDGGQGMCVDGSCVPAICTLQNEATLCVDDNPCTDNYCNTDTGQCETTPSPDGPAPEQDAGDCYLVMCASGALQPVIDNGDVPIDGNQCTDDVCAAGVPSNPLVTTGAPCDQAGGRVCNPAGVCVECNAPADCITEPAETECNSRTCTNFACGTSYVPVNVPLAIQYAGDCQRRECNGSGSVIDVDDNGDLPVDGNDCTFDQCNGGTPANPHKSAGTPCGSGQVCDSTGHCGCALASDCGSNTQCMWWTCDSLYCNQHYHADGYAVPNGQTPNNCHTVRCNSAGNEENRIDDTDHPVDDGNVCTDETCSNGVPQHPANSANCNDGVYCNGSDTCANTTCSVHGVNPCPGPNGNNNCNESCNEANDNCTAYDGNGAACNDGAWCNGSDTCGSGSCSNHAGNPCPGHNTGPNCNDSCNEGSDNCTGSDASGTTCNDGLYCTATDTCNGSGSCVGTGNPCPGNNTGPNCNDSCNEGSDNCTGSDASGTSCNDGLYCTATDTCNGSGTCVGTGNPCPGNNTGPNCNDSCNEGSDNCTGSDASGTSCNDGLYCTVTDTCNGSGTCQGTGNPCPGNNTGPNCNDSCNESLDNCTGNDASGTSCNDGLYCTLTDTCNGSGTCQGTGDPCAAALSSCDSDCSKACDEGTDSCTANSPDQTPCKNGGTCNDHCGNLDGICHNG
jgi:hypothetical protein